MALSRASLFILIPLTAIGIYYINHTAKLTTQHVVSTAKSVKESHPVPSDYVLYTGPMYHIFFHSLIVYPELAFRHDKRSKFFETYMITKYEFDRILEKLYKNNFVLIDIHSLYTVDDSGKVFRKKLYLPPHKKPLIISVDDVNYYHNQTGRGLSQKLILDNAGTIATEIVGLDGKTTITHDGDVMPIVDTFVSQHPDFSIDGAKGIIAVTGYDGVLGYRTQGSAASSPTYTKDVAAARQVIEKLKATGWQFASHSYSHDSKFVTGKITLEELKKDMLHWDTEVGPLVGNTDIYIGPFGQIFGPKDPRRAHIVSQGFNVLCGVGTDLYFKYFDTHIIMDRAPIDGMRLTKTPKQLKSYFKASEILDPIRLR